MVFLCVTGDKKFKGRDHIRLDSRVCSHEKRELSNKGGEKREKIILEEWRDEFD